MAELGVVYTAVGELHYGFNSQKTMQSGLTAALANAYLGFSYPANSMNNFTLGVATYSGQFQGTAYSEFFPNACPQVNASLCDLNIPYTIPGTAVFGFHTSALKSLVGNGNVSIGVHTDADMSVTLNPGTSGLTTNTLSVGAIVTMVYRMNAEGCAMCSSGGSNCAVCKPGFTLVGGGTCRNASILQPLGPEYFNFTQSETILDRYDIFGAPPRAAPFYIIHCPYNDAALQGKVWGSGGWYTLDSVLCTAGLHSSAQNGGFYILQFDYNVFSGRISGFPAELANGVQSLSWPHPYPIIFHLTPYTDPFRDFHYRQALALHAQYAAGSVAVPVEAIRGFYHQRQQTHAVGTDSSRTSLISRFMKSRRSKPIQPL